MFKRNLLEWELLTIFLIFKKIYKLINFKFNGEIRRNRGWQMYEISQRDFLSFSILWGNCIKYLFVVINNGFRWKKLEVWKVLKLLYLWNSYRQPICIFVQNILSVFWKWSMHKNNIRYILFRVYSKIDMALVLWKV